VTGFNTVFADQSVKEEFDATLKVWIERGESKQLKAAAQMLSKSQKKV
jgi:hypothetical protein